MKILINGRCLNRFLKSVGKTLWGLPTFWGKIHFLVKKNMWQLQCSEGLPRNNERKKKYLVHALFDFFWFIKGCSDLHEKDWLWLWEKIFICYWHKSLQGNHLEPKNHWFFGDTRGEYRGKHMCWLLFETNWLQFDDAQLGVVPEIWITMITEKMAKRGSFCQKGWGGTAESRWWCWGGVPRPNKPLISI